MKFKLQITTLLIAIFLAPIYTLAAPIPSQTPSISQPTPSISTCTNCQFKNLSSQLDAATDSIRDLCMLASRSGFLSQTQQNSEFYIRFINRCGTALATAAPYTIKLTTKCKDGSSGTLDRTKDTDQELKDWLKKAREMLGNDKSCSVSELTINGKKVKITDGKPEVDKEGMPVYQ